MVNPSPQIGGSCNRYSAQAGANTFSYQAQRMRVTHGPSSYLGSCGGYALVNWLIIQHHVPILPTIRPTFLRHPNYRPLADMDKHPDHYFYLAYDRNREIAHDVYDAWIEEQKALGGHNYVYLVGDADFFMPPSESLKTKLQSCV